MNIFILDNDIQKCVEYHCDKHVVKMILEYCQFGKYMINIDSPIININGDALLIMRKIYNEQNIVAQDKRIAVTFNDLQSKFELV